MGQKSHNVFFAYKNVSEQKELKKAFTNEPAHEIMALFVLRKLILQTRMRSHQAGLDAWCLVGPFVYFRTYVCEQRRLWRDCADVNRLCHQ